MTLRAYEFREIEPPASPPPYWKRRLAELVEQGRAAIREKGHPRSTAAARMHRTAARLSWIFASRLVVMQDALVYYVPGAYKLAFRRPNPRPALNGKVYVPPLPAGALYVGRYAYPFSRRAFLRDLVDTMGGKP